MEFRLRERRNAHRVEHLVDGSIDTLAYDRSLERVPNSETLKGHPVLCCQ
jgi:hypothetical protein